MGPSDFRLFLPLKKHVAGKQFATDADVKQAATFSLESLDTDFFYAAMQSLVPRWDRCLNVDDHYMEV
jgi:hypothetical protein